MKFDPNDKEYFFNEEMILSPEGEQALRQSFGEYRKSVLNNPSGWLGKMMKQDKDSPRYFVESPVFQWIGRACILGGILATVIALRNKSNMESYRFYMILGLIASIAIGLYMLVKIIGYKTADKTVYTEEVSAACIGYWRTMEGGGDDILYPVTSPVFEYHYNGQKYQACYDTFEVTKDAKIPLGSTTTIRISPDAPNRVEGFHKNLLSTPIVFVIICVLAAGALSYFLWM